MLYFYSIGQRGNSLLSAVSFGYWGKLFKHYEKNKETFLDACKKFLKWAEDCELKTGEFQTELKKIILTMKENIGNKTHLEMLEYLIEKYNEPYLSLVILY